MTAMSVTREYTSKGTWLADVEADLAAAVGTTLDIQNSGDLILVLKNGGMSSRTVTNKAVADPFGRGGSTVGDVVMTLAAGKIGIFEFSNPPMFNNAGVQQVTLDATTSVTAALYRVRKTS